MIQSNFLIFIDIYFSKFKRVYNELSSVLFYAGQCYGGAQWQHALKLLQTFQSWEVPCGAGGYCGSRNKLMTS